MAKHPSCIFFTFDPKAPFKKLAAGTIFVFGSNLKGVHGAGTAKTAVDYYGAKMFSASGRQGQSYALPTCSEPGRGLSLTAIRTHVENLRSYVLNHPELIFNIASPACGYAGYTPKDIAPMFKDFVRCQFPSDWAPYL